MRERSTLDMTGVGDRSGTGVDSFVDCAEVDNLVDYTEVDNFVDEDTGIGSVVCPNWLVDEVSPTKRGGLVGWLTYSYDGCLACLRLWSVSRFTKVVAAPLASVFTGRCGKYRSRNDRGVSLQ